LNEPRTTLTKFPTQVLEFLNAHRDTIVILLKIDLDDIPLAVLDEINLVVAICTAILPLVSKSELVCISYTAALQ
jgi:nuclear pore complex protein Nup205